MICVWQETDEFWTTACGNAWVLIDGTPADNHMQFCPYCGGRLSEPIVIKREYSLDEYGTVLDVLAYIQSLIPQNNTDYSVMDLKERLKFPLWLEREFPLLSTWELPDDGYLLQIDVSEETERLLLKFHGVKLVDGKNEH